MPRKSKADHLTELFGGKWKFDTTTSSQWQCEDGRICYRVLNCLCWQMPWIIGKSCKCIPVYKLDDGTVVEFDDHRIYRKNGVSTYPKKG